MDSNSNSEIEVPTADSVNFINLMVSVGIKVVPYSSSTIFVLLIHISMLGF